VLIVTIGEATCEGTMIGETMLMAGACGTNENNKIK
jgi:hypothetical protein